MDRLADRYVELYQRSACHESAPDDRRAHSSSSPSSWSLVIVAGRASTTGWSSCGTGSRTPGRRSTSSSSGATTSSPTWSRRSRATPPTSGRPSRPSSRPATWRSAPRASGEQAQAENMLTGALKSLFAVSEAYPDLKANQNFLNLQEELTGTEDRIAYARQFYNDTVLRYNTKIQTFPAVVIAGMFRFTAREYFEAEPESRENVQVSFNDPPVGRRRPRSRRPPRPPPVAPDRRRWPGSGDATAAPDRGRSRCTTRSRPNKRRSVAADRRLRASSSSLVGRRVQHPARLRAGRAGHRRRRRRRRWRSAATGSPTRSPCAMSRRPAGLGRGVPPPPQPRRGAVHRRRAAQAPPLRHRGRRPQRLRHRPQPQARRRRRHHRAARAR